MIRRLLYIIPIIAFDLFLARILAIAFQFATGNPNLPLVTMVYLEAIIYSLAAIILLLSVILIVLILRFTAPAHR